MDERFHFTPLGAVYPAWEVPPELYARLTPEEAAEKWERNTSAATADYERGVRRVDTAPGILAARNVQGYVQGVQQNAGKWQEGVASVGLGEWQEAAITKGAQRIPQGVQAARPKMAAFQADLLPHIDRGKQQLATMPKLTEADSIARATFWIRHMGTFRRTRR